MRQFGIVALEIGLIVHCLNYLSTAFLLLSLQGLMVGDPIWLVIRNSNQLLVQIIKA